ncbi:hypothetical protein Rhopal_006261-T1 [Rhodotorula paludigena]|uniref:Uncharacterized protein n=1 Tax=Rhodotorula paludigena TaxID=86838 RepID=A0AAV5GVH1_9BASI|nr:hypothetical protein Rhopal_006261-T1 [Rhodotorula paludigena]
MVQLDGTASVDLLVLGAGWTASFLLPHLRAEHPHISFAATTRDGRNGTIRWAFDPERDGKEQFAALPRAKTVVVVFPIRGEGGSRRLVTGYEEAVGQRVRWVQLGSSGIYDGGPTLAALAVKAAAASSDSEKLPLAHSPLEWTTRHSPYDRTNARAIAEDELLGQHTDTVVLNLVGLWGGARNPSNWIARIAPTFEALEAKGSVHLVHGLDVARAIVAVHLAPSLPTGSGESAATSGRGQRWIVSDLRVYDWWDLVAAHPGSSTSVAPAATADSEPSPPRAKWVQQLLKKHDVRGLPRSAVELGRAIDAREFWEAFELAPVKGRWEEARA